ncbi:roadblock/LC7 domain-containing protein [Nocardia aurea]|uniref:roadblock/LC7 domain-containing protein n=1 Tax=Nocardia aurea TaxID=2144174 RepID=UPI000D6890C6|nr:roadblock/LC7 domain-containing protein [Nocardia aurea]
MNEHIGNSATARGLDWLLNDLLGRLAGAENAVVLSADGLVIARSRSMSREDGEHLAAMASALGSLARGVGDQFGKGRVQQTVVELEFGYLVVTEAGTGACLALLASDRADLGLVAYEMNVIVSKVGDALSATPRAAVSDSLIR